MLAELKYNGVDLETQDEFDYETVKKVVVYHWTKGEEGNDGPGGKGAGKRQGQE